MAAPTWDRRTFIEALGGVTAGATQLVAHAATKALLFLAAGAWLSALGTKQLAALHGAARRWPLVGVAATLGLASLAGVAPLSLWASKEAVLAAALPHSALLYGVGLVGAIELMADHERRTPFDPALKVGAQVAEWALEYGVILRPLGDVISFCPPLIIDRAEIDFLFDAVHRALDRVASELQDEHRRKVA